MVGHLDAHGGLAGDGGLHAHIRHGQVQGDVIGQRGDAADLDARHGLHLIPGDRRAAGNIQHTGADPKALQRVHQLLGVGLQLILGVGVAFLLGFFKQLDGRVLILVGVHRLGFLGRGRSGCLLGGRRFFHGCRHQRVDILFLHRFGGDADPAVRIRVAALGHGMFGTHTGRLVRLRRGHHGLDGRSRGSWFLRSRRPCDGRIKGIAGHRPGLLFRGLCRRGLLRLCKEVLSRRFHGIRHDGPDGGLGCRAQRVHAKGATRPRDEGFDGLTAALLHLGAVRAKVHIKGSARAGCPHPHRRHGWGRLRFRLGLRRLVRRSGRAVRGLLQLLGHLMAPVQHTGHPVRQTQPEGLFRFGFVFVFFQLLRLVVLVCGFLCGLPLGAALGTAGCALLVHGHALCVHPAGHVAQPLPDLSRSEVKNVQADAERQHQHDEVCRRPAAEQQQVAAQHRTQCAAGQPRLITVLVAGRHHLEGRQPLRLDVGKHDHRAACKHEPQRQLTDVGQQVLAPRVQHGQAAHRCTQHKTAAAKQAKQHLMQRFPHRVAFHKGKAHQQKPRKQGPKPCRQALFRAFFARR